MIQSFRSYVMRVLPVVLAGTLQAAPVGTAFTYQGYLSDASGVPAQGAHDLTFALFDTPTGGTALANVMHDDVLLNSGVFTASLDFGLDPFNGQAYWLEIGVRPGTSTGDFTTLAPRQALSPTPYAIRAGSVDGINITGMLPETALPPTVAYTDRDVRFTGMVQSQGFSGDGGGLTGLNIESVGPLGTFTLSPLRFLSGDSLSVGNYPWGIASADLNRDGWPDLVSAIARENHLTVLTNDGRGRLALATNIPVVNHVSDVAVGDLNGDGAMDLVASIFGDNGAGVNAIGEFTNNGAGGFSLSQQTNAPGAPYAVIVADLNQDNRPDVVSANWLVPSLSILTNNGQGRLGLAMNLEVGSSPSELVAADVNGDTWLDLIVVEWGDGTLGVFTNNQHGSFAFSTRVPVGAYAHEVAAADLNRDGAVDLIATFHGQGNQLVYYLNDGLGGFPVPQMLTTGFAPSGLAVADFNRDGWPDFIESNADDDNCLVFLNNRRGGFDPALTLPSGDNPNKIVLLDLNGDGSLDLAAACVNSHTITTHLSLPPEVDATLRHVSTRSISGDGSGLRNLPAASMTGILLPEVMPPVVARLDRSAVFSGSVSAPAFAGNGHALTDLNLESVGPAGTFAWAAGGLTRSADPTVNSRAFGVTAADINGDGWPDLISGQESGTQLSVLLNNQQGGFTRVPSLSVGPGPLCVTAADLNGDGWVDLANVNYGGSSVTLLTNNGTGVFAQSTNLPTPHSPQRVAAADVNGDGKMDLVSANQSSSLAVFTNAGGGRFLRSGTPVTPVEPVDLAVADVNGDGAVDVVTAHYALNALAVLTNDGRGGFTLALQVSVGSRPLGVAAADLNGDGWPDLIGGNLDDKTVSIAMNNRHGGFDAARTLAVGRGPHGVAAADVNGDGRMDVLCTDHDDNAVSVALNDGQGWFAPAMALPVGQIPVSLAVADFNRDGITDFASANFSTLTVYTSQGSDLSIAPNLVAKGNLRVQGLLRSGSESGTGEAPSPAGLVVRRINSSNPAANQVVARAGNLTLERDGTSGGFLLRYPASPGRVTIACLGLNAAAGSVNVLTTLANPGSAGTLPIYTDAQNVSHFQGSFGLENGHLTQVTLTRFDGGYWAGTVTSTFNQ
jgi:hypothetical protein